MTELSVAGVVAGYGDADEILKGVDFRIDAGEIVCIIGPNRAGKSTLLKVIAGLLKPKSGRVMLGDADITSRRPRDIARAGLAYVPQEANVFPSLSVRENLADGRICQRASRGAAHRCRVHPISGSRRQTSSRRADIVRPANGQMLAMAMALMVEPRVLLLDEPSAGLSPLAAERLFDAITEINRQGLSVVIVEQNASEALNLSNRAYILVDGKNSRTGDAKQLAGDPDIRRVFLGG